MVKKYKSNKLLLLYAVVFLIVITIATNSRNENFDYSDLFYDFVLGVPLLLLVYVLTEFIYITIDSKGKISNSGYRTFGKDILDVSHVCCIYRIPQFVPSWLGGSLMLIYSHNDKGVLTHSALREYAYSESTLRNLLVHIKNLNPAIEFDSEYEEFLQNKRALRTASSNTLQQLKQRLNSRGLL